MKPFKCYHTRLMGENYAIGQIRFPTSKLLVKGPVVWFKTSGLAQLKN